MVPPRSGQVQRGGRSSERAGSVPAVENEPSEADPHEGDDPFEGLVFDDDFIRSASIVEDSAVQRDRAARQANLQRLLADRAAQADNAEHARRRSAPEDDDAFAFDPDEVPPRRSGRLVVAVVVVISILVVYVLSQFFNGGGSTDAIAPVTTAPGAANAGAVAPGTAGETTSDAGLVRPQGWPSMSAEQRSEPIGQPGAVPDGGGSHTFMQLQSDGVRPVAYDPCRPIHYVTRTAGAPAGGAELLGDAVASVSAATGLRFVDDGETDETPGDDREAFQQDRYGDRWAPVLITWSDPVESPRLSAEDTDPSDGSTADVLGYAGSAGVGLIDAEGVDATDQVFVTGQLTLDGPDFLTMLGEFDGYARARAVVLHEFGHLVGLDHVVDTSQLMAPAASPELTGFGPGDLQGLAALGQGACVPRI